MASDDKVEPDDPLANIGKPAAALFDAAFSIAGQPVPVATILCTLVGLMPTGKTIVLNDRIDELAKQAFKRDAPQILNELKCEAFRSLGAFAGDDTVEMLAKAVIASAKEGQNHPWKAFDRERFWITLRSITGQQYRLLVLLRDNFTTAGGTPLADRAGWLTEWLKGLHNDLSGLTRPEATGAIQGLEILGLLGGNAQIQRNEFAPVDVQLSPYGNAFVSFVESWQIDEEDSEPGQPSQARS